MANHNIGIQVTIYAEEIDGPADYAALIMLERMQEILNENLPHSFILKVTDYQEIGDDFVPEDEA
jgi:hypothetical protein